MPHLQRVLEATEVDGIVIHPAMAYTPEGGVLHRFARDAVERRAIRVVESEQVRWPLENCEDLAMLYALALKMRRSDRVISARLSKDLPSAASRGLSPNALR